MVSHHPAKFCGHRHCDSGDIMLLVAEEENSRCSRFNPPLLFISIGHWLKAQTYQVINSNPGHTRSKQQLNKNFKITFASPSKSTGEMEKEKEKKERQLQSVLRYTQNNWKKTSSVANAIFKEVRLFLRYPSLENQK